MNNTKTKKNYIYNGLGFPVVLESATFTNIRGKWHLKIDVLKVAQSVFKSIPYKKSGLTGAEIRFARTHLDLSKRKFADQLNVSHTAVNKWEQSDQEKAGIDPLVEVALRAYLQLQNNDDKNFSKFYREIMNDARKISKEKEVIPLKIAI